MSIMFNEKCINEEMQPIYIYIYVAGFYKWKSLVIKNDIESVYTVNIIHSF